MIVGLLDLNDNPKKGISFGLLPKGTESHLRFQPDATIALPTGGCGPRSKLTSSKGAVLIHSHLVVLLVVPLVIELVQEVVVVLLLLPVVLV